MARNPHPLSGEYRTLRSGRKVWIDDRGVAHLVTPRGNMAGARHYDWDDYGSDHAAERAKEAREDGRDEAREWGGEDIPS
jgi:hypothetical protein